ncbi:MAG: hypothetical protein ACYS8Z_09000, partial [Planctomycetota bacterium]
MLSETNTEVGLDAKAGILEIPLLQGLHYVAISNQKTIITTIVYRPCSQNTRKLIRFFKNIFASTRLIDRRIATERRKKATISLPQLYSLNPSDYPPSFAHIKKKNLPSLTP